MGPAFPTVVLASMVAVGCSPAPSGHIDVVDALGLSPPDCTVHVDTPLVGAPLVDLTNARQLSIPLRASARIDDDPDGRATLSINSTRTFFTAAGILNDVPTSAAVPRLSIAVASPELLRGGSAFFVDVITADEIFALRGEGSLVDALASPDGRGRIEAHVALVGSLTVDGSHQEGGLIDTTRFHKDTGTSATVTSEALTIPVDLCAGCLVAPACGADQQLAQGCFQGVDQSPSCEARSAGP